MPKIQRKLNLKKNFKSDSKDSDTNSWTDEETPQLVIADSSNVSRWICMMNESTNINVAFLHILKEIEENIIERIDVFQKDLESKIEMKFTGQRKLQRIFNNANIKELKNELGVSLPLKDIESFESFDNELGKDSKKMDAMRELFLHRIDGTTTLVRDVYTILKYMCTESVLVHYTCVGKKFRGQRKKSFCSTNIYLCMEDVLSHKHKQASTDLKLNTMISNYFARINFKNKPVKPDNNLEE